MSRVNIYMTIFYLTWSGVLYLFYRWLVPEDSKLRALWVITIAFCVFLLLDYILKVVTN